MKHGRKWRVLAHRDDGKSFEARDEGTFDELVVDGWLHIEQMSANAWWMQVGDAMINVSLNAKGEASVTIQRGEYGPERPKTP